MSSLLSGVDWLRTPVPWITSCNYALLLALQYPRLPGAAFLEGG
jgi:hypothetical protein